MKKIILSLSLFIILLSGGIYVCADEFPNLNNTYLMDYDDYKKITPYNIKSLQIIRYTEAGMSVKNIEDINQINGIYNYLKSIMIKRETKYSCEDNTTVYSFELSDNSKVRIEIECNWVVIKRKNYDITFPNKNF